MRYEWQGGAQLASQIAPAIQAGFQTGQRTAALARYQGNPQAGINALLPVDPTLAMQLQGSQDQRARLAAEEARRAKLEQQQAATQQLEQHRERITAGAKLIEQIQPRDDAGWQQVLSAMRQYGYDVSDIPPTFDPTYVDGVRQLGRAMGAQPAAPDLVVIDGVAIDKRTGQPVFESPYPRIVSGPGGIYAQDRIGIGRGGTGSPPAGRVVDSAAGLPPGWTIVDDDEGGPSPSGSATFP